jgi:DNA-binding winged helix-turn-helix (wHTH) protein/TolB-like protein
MKGNVRYSFGAFELDAGLRELRSAGAPVRLTPKDVDVLLALVERSGELVEKEALFAAVWGGVVVEDCNLARHVANLRRVLDDDSEHPTFIETIPRRGYRFLAPVAVVEAAAFQAAPPSIGPVDSPPPLPIPPAPARRLGALGQVGRGALILAVLVTLPAASWLVGQGHGHAAGPIRSLAVLPVTNLTGDARHDHLAEALGEMTVNDLGRLQRTRSAPFRVLPRSAALSYRATTKRHALVGGELAVDGLVEASILQADGRLRLSAVLVDVRSGAVAWAQELEGGPEEFMELQDDLVFGLATHLGLQPGPDDLPLAGRHLPSAAGLAHATE